MSTPLQPDAHTEPAYKPGQRAPLLVHSVSSEKDRIIRGLEKRIETDEREIKAYRTVAFDLWELYIGSLSKREEVSTTEMLRAIKLREWLINV